MKEEVKWLVRKEGKSAVVVVAPLAVEEEVQHPPLPAFEYCSINLQVGKEGKSGAAVVAALAVEEVEEEVSLQFGKKGELSVVVVAALAEEEVQHRSLRASEYCSINLQVSNSEVEVVAASVVERVAKAEAVQVRQV